MLASTHVRVIWALGDGVTGSRRQEEALIDMVKVAKAKIYMIGQRTALGHLPVFFFLDIDEFIL